MEEQSGFNFDVFVSHSDCDKQFAHEWRLTRLGILTGTWLQLKQVLGPRRAIG